MPRPRLARRSNQSLLSRPNARIAGQATPLNPDFSPPSSTFYGTAHLPFLHTAKSGAKHLHTLPPQAW